MWETVSGVCSQYGGTSSWNDPRRVVLLTSVAPLNSLFSELALQKKTLVQELYSYLRLLVTCGYLCLDKTGTITRVITMWIQWRAIPPVYIDFWWSIRKHWVLEKGIYDGTKSSWLTWRVRYLSFTVSFPWKRCKRGMGVRFSTTGGEAETGAEKTRQRDYLRRSGGQGISWEIFLPVPEGPECYCRCASCKILRWLRISEPGPCLVPAFSSGQEV